ncbi:SPOR domain-containing protein [Massilia violaceinigra]|uniref:SPOR domain-containing protein n=1 Tax=Massilia violaceinigra TaxID=2045208 RepID=A0A2D2DLU4_9BURK|nr:SPOR domain-containing protein [Massilia violaceinigra]ATQ75930.1 SPOR domain-containing protein [Massilia violaceinigra]
MGLFSFLNKNKQESTEDSGYYSKSDDDTVAARARSKRASSAGEPAARRGKDARAAADPVLPEKKRARRRLVGAVALALGVAVGLPMVLDSEPKPLAGDIDIRIPSKDKVAPQAQPRAVAAADALDKREEIVDVPPVPMVTLPKERPVPREEIKPEAKPEVKTVAKPEVKPAVKPDVKPVAKPEPKPVVKPEPKVVAKPEVKPDKPKPEPKVAEVKHVEKVPEKHVEKTVEKPVDKPLAKAPPKVEEKEKPAVKPPVPDAQRAISILEGKAPEKAVDENQRFVVQVAALATQEKVNELQAKLSGAGIRSFTHKIPTQSGDRIRVQVGPFSKDEAEKVRAKLSKMGLSGIMVPG